MSERGKIRRNLSTPEGREFWRHADEIAAEVDTWPAWKRAGINEAESRPEPRPKVDVVEPEPDPDPVPGKLKLEID